MLVRLSPVTETFPVLEQGFTWKEVEIQLNLANHVSDREQMEH